MLKYPVKDFEVMLCMQHASLRTCLAARAAICATTVEQRTQRVPSPLKPAPATSALPDAVGEQAAFSILQDMANELSVEVRVIIDAQAGLYHTLQPASARQPCMHHASDPTQPSNEQATPMPGHTDQFVWVYLDAVDGTLKLSGLENSMGPGNNPNPSPRIARIVNDGSWGVGLSMTAPCTIPLDQLCMGHMALACILDAAAPDFSELQPLSSGPVPEAGAASATASAGFPAGTPQLERPTAAFPPCVMAVATSLSMKDPSATSYTTFEVVRSTSSSIDNTIQGRDSARLPTAAAAAADSTCDRGVVGGGGALWGPRLHTSSATRLGAVFAYLDAFQAFDRNTQAPGDEQLVTGLYTRLINRNDGGAFDVLRTYGNLSSLVRTMLGWRDRWSASQLPLPGVCDTGVTINTPHDGNTAGAGVDTYDGSHHRVAAGEGGDALWLEPQAGVYLVVNENAPNMVPCVPIILGAGGCAVDFLGQPLIGRKLVAGRLSVAYAANEQLLERVLGLVSSARAASGTDGR